MDNPLEEMTLEELQDHLALLAWLDSAPNLHYRSHVILNDEIAAVEERIRELQNEEA